MKKVLSVILMNIFLIIAVFIIAEIYAYKSVVKQKNEHSKNYIVNQEPLKPFPFIKMREFEPEYESFFKHALRKPVGTNYTKKPIVLFGCSFTYGYRLGENENFSYYLSHISHRPVYNRAYNSWGLPHMVYQLSRNDFYQEVPPPEYVIYLFSKHHLQMFYDYTFQLWDEDICLRYKNVNGKLVKVKNPPKFIQGSYLLKTIFRKMAENSYNCVFSPDDEKLVLLHFTTAKNEMKKHWKNIKFVILLWDETTETKGFDEKLIRDLEKEGFIVIKMDEISGFDVSDGKYSVMENDPHPGKLLWQLFCPKFVEKLNL